MNNTKTLKETVTNCFGTCNEPVHDLKDVFKAIDTLNGFDGRVPVYEEQEDGIYALSGYDEMTY